MSPSDSAESPSSAPPRTDPRRRRRAGGGVLRSGKALAALVAALVVALVALGGALWWQYQDSGDSGERLPVAVLVQEARQATEVLTDREVDSRPLTERELFERGAEELSSQDVTFTLDTAELAEDCSDAVWGERPQAALADADCTQVGRAGYVSDDHIGMVALFNLADVESAQALATSLEPQDEDGDGDGFLTPVDGGPFDELGAGYSTAEATVNGHYLMVVWAQERGSTSAEERANLATPLIALTQFEMPIYRRLAEYDLADESDDDAEDEAAEEAPAEGEAGAEEPAAEEQPVEEPVEDAPVTE